MDQIQDLAPSLQRFACSQGTTYTCPVKEQMRFSMERTRTCRRCGMGSSRREFFTNLSLDLFPGWSTERLLEHHLKETELEFRCKCGGSMSSQKAAFASLPNVLILNLKRFTYNSNFMQEKMNAPNYINRDLVVSSKQDAGCFSLVGIMSHLGFSADHGHYICDRLDPEDDPSELTDKWLTFDDSNVFPSTGRDCSRKREKSAYVLLYKRIMV